MATSWARTVAAVALLLGMAHACTFDWDNYEPHPGIGGVIASGGSGGTSGAGGSGGGAAGAGGSGASQGGSGAGGGGVGGSGGGGGQPVALVNRDLVARYHLDEADAGQGPSAALDAAPLSLPLPITYAPELSYVEIDGHRGLRWSAADGDGRAMVPLLGTKILSSLHGSTTATIEVVAHVEDDGYYSRFTHVGIGSIEGGRFDLTPSSALTSLRLHIATSGTNAAGEWDADLATLQRAVLHLVLDTSLAAADDRARVYVNGVAAPLTSPPVAIISPPAQNQTLSFDATHYFVLGNKQPGLRSLKGTIYYVAIYSAALTQAEVSNNAALLAVNDDQ